MRNVDDVMVRSYYRNISNRASDLPKIQQQLASGKRFTHPSEAPTDAIILMRVRSDQAGLARQTERLAAKREVLVQSSNILSNIDDMMLEIDSLALEALTDTTDKKLAGRSGNADQHADCRNYAGSLKRVHGRACSRSLHAAGRRMG